MNCRGLLSHVQQSADMAHTTDTQEPIQKIFRSLEYIFKFIIQSRLLFARATGCQYEENFKKDLLSVFAAINKMLSQPGEIILPTQVLDFKFQLQSPVFFTLEKMHIHF
jgi:dedicator of cytokinesis protein 3